MLHALRNLFRSSTISKPPVAIEPIEPGAVPYSDVRHSSSVAWHKIKGHMLIVGGNRRDKKAAIQIPAALAFNGPLVVIEREGRLFEQTATRREQAFKQQIIYIDPDSEKSAGINPLDFLDASDEDLYQQAEEIASVIIWRSGAAEKIYTQTMNLMARSALAVSIATKVITRGEGKPNLMDAVEFLNDSIENVRKKFADITEATVGINIYGEHFFDIRLAASLLASVNDEMLTAVIATIRTASYFTRDNGILSRTTFDVSKLNSGKMSLYINVSRDFASRNCLAIDILANTILRVLSAPRNSDALVIWNDMEFTADLIKKKPELLVHCNNTRTRIIGNIRDLHVVEDPQHDAYIQNWVSCTETIVVSDISYCADAKFISGILGDVSAVVKSTSLTKRGKSEVMEVCRPLVESHEIMKATHTGFMVMRPDIRRYKFISSSVSTSCDADGQTAKPPVPESVKAASLANTAS